MDGLQKFAIKSPINAVIGNIVTYSRSMIARAAVAAMLACPTDVVAHAAASGVCKQPETGTDRVPLLSPPLAKIVVGKGRLQFYSAPNGDCRMDGVFVVPRESLVAYAETNDGWTSVMYISSGQQGWVRSKRLKTTGTVGPSQ